MSNILTPGLQVTEGKRILKLRELPVPGTVLVKEGEQVTADQIVAKAEIPGDLVILRLPEKMGLQIFEVLEGLKCSEGSLVHKGDLLCEYSGLFGFVKSRYESPIEGVIEFISQSNGHIGIRKQSLPIDLTAYIPGKIVKIHKDRSVEIELTAAFVQGIFGVGGERSGKLFCVDVTREKFLTEDDLPEDCEGLVLVGGTNPDINTIRKAADKGARGLIVGAIDDRALGEYLGYELGIALTGDEELPMTLIATEGFGQIPISERVVNLCKKFAGKVCSINGATQVRAGALRPEIIIERLDQADNIESNVVQTGLVVGSKVRVIRVPYFGILGTVLNLPVEPELIETGAHARVVEVELDTNITVRVPRANVELLNI